jgi:hypothetical protein
MIRFLFCSFLMLGFLSVRSQSIPSDIQLDDQLKPYLVHVVGQKENYYSIGRIYNISPKIMAPYNQLDMTKTALSIGQTIRIPLNETNFWQRGVRTEQEALIPLHYQLKNTQSVTALSNQLKGDVDLIRSWNQLNTDELNKGDRIIIGYLKVDKTLSPIANQAVPIRKEPDIKTNPIAQETNKQPERKSLIVETPVVADKEKPVAVKQSEIKKITKESLYKGEGVFKSEYEQQMKATSASRKDGGEATVFKSTSGWTNGKYYLLMNGVERGTVVLIKNPSNGKVIYAKVLSSVQDVKTDSKEKLIISEAAADQLGLGKKENSLELIWAAE